MMIHATFLGINSFREVMQLLVNGIVNGAGYGLLGAAFALILGTTGRFHFALSLNYTLAAFLAAVLIAEGGLPFGLAVAIGLLIGVVSSVLCEAVVYRPLARRAGVNTLLSVFVASLGLVIAGQNLLQLQWGSTPLPLPGPSESTIKVGSVVVSSFGVALLVAAV